MEYGYVRVSTKEQNIARQMEEMYNHGLTDKNIFIDKQSGKDFDRVSYQKLKKKLKKGDLLIIKSIDRLGRNYDMIIQEWSEITKVIKADIFVIDFPLLDTREKPDNLVGKFISDIVLQVLSFVAQNERENIRRRQAEGIRIAKEKGIHCGRKKLILPDNFEETILRDINGEITVNEGCQITSMKKASYLKYKKIYMQNHDIKKTKPI